MTFNDTLYAAFRRAGILKEAMRGLSASEGADGLLAFNSMIDSWSVQRLAVFAIGRQEFSLVSGQQDYLVGDDPSADWQIPQPTEITQAGYVFTSTSPPVEQPFDIYTPQKWQALSPKTLQSTNPYVLYFQRNTVAGAVSVMGTVKLWPIPIDATIAVALYPQMRVLAVTDPTATIIFPGGYQEAVETNLAVRLAALFPKRAMISPITVQLAKTSFAWLKSKNEVSLEMRVEAGGMQDAGNRSGYNLFSNAYNGRI